MIDFIPLEHYFEVYINFLFVITLLIGFHAILLPIENLKNLRFTNFMGMLIFLLVTFYLGLRPISGYWFGDTSTYARHFKYYINGGEIVTTKDVLFHIYMKTCASIMNIHWFFTLCVFLYIFPLYKLSKNIFKEYWFYSFFMFIISFSFYTYGVNGIRNGMATSFFLWGLCFREKKIIMGVFFLIAASIHKTMLLPILAFLVTFLTNNPKIFLKGWLICIPLSLIMGSVWVSLFASIGFGDDDRLAGYLTSQAAAGTFASTGFRWDFLFHSSFAVFAGWYFIFKKKFKDKLYIQLFNTYLICNGFWILVIKANYSNRFAYLSWFMMGLIIIYPFLKKEFFKNHYLMISKVILVYFLFTYLMYYIHV